MFGDLSSYCDSVIQSIRELENLFTRGSICSSTEAALAVWPKFAAVGKNFRLHSMMPPCCGLVEQIIFNLRIGCETDCPD